MSAFDIALDYQRDRERRALANPYHLTSPEADLSRALLAGDAKQKIEETFGLSKSELAIKITKLCEKLGANGETHLLLLLSTLQALKPEAKFVDIDDFRIAFGLGGSTRA